MPVKTIATGRALMGPRGVFRWWDPNNEGLCVHCAFQPKGAGSFAASLIDLTGNGNNAGDPGGAATPAWAALTGWTFDGIGDYLTTNFTPQNDQSQSMLVQYTNVTNNGTLCGTNEGANRRYKICPDNGANQVQYFNGVIIQTIPLLLAGNLGIAGNQGYRNGAADGGAIGAWGVAATVGCAIGAEMVIAAAAFCACSIQAIVLYDCVLTAPQMLSVATAMAAL